MSALHRKLLRDLARLWGQAVTIALVVACGIASYVAMQTAYDSLLAARDTYYAERRLPDLFGHIERAPEEIGRRLESIHGVARVHTRIVVTVSLPLPTLREPAMGRIVSLPANGEPPLAALHLVAGRFPTPGRADEVVVGAPFAEAHRLGLGASVPAVVNGAMRTLRVVGTALSPEYVFAVGGGSFIQDDRRFGILWMDRAAIAPAFRLEGAFNDVVAQLAPDASVERAVFDVRRVLEPYGVVSVTGRDKLLSNHVLEGELGQLRSFARALPAIFLAVAALLVNIVLSRMLHLQRGQIATLKAVGYRRREIAVHFFELASVIVGAGALLGVAGGVVLGRGMLTLYRPYFRFAELSYRVAPRIVVSAVAVSVLSATVGGAVAVWRAARLPPAEAMQPEAPPRFRRGFLERAGVFRFLGPSARMVARGLLRQPLRTALSCLGVALGVAVVGGARFAYDAMDLLLSVQFEGAQREDFEVALKTSAPYRVVREVRSMPGVVEVEAQRVVPVRIGNGARVRDSAIFGFDERPVPLRRVASWPHTELSVPARGVLLGERFANVLGVRPGDAVDVEVLEGDRRRVPVAVAGVVPDVFGLFAYTSLESVADLLGEERRVTSVMVRVSPGQEEPVLDRLKACPLVLSVSPRREVVRRFWEQTEHMWVTTAVMTAFGAIIAFGVVYNQARIALSVRSRDLATLRVLGFSRGEISSMLLGELAVYVIVGLPIGLALGRGIVSLVIGTVDPETYRLPAYMSPQTYAFAALVTVAAGVASALLVRRRLDRLDLIGVLKARE